MGGREPPFAFMRIALGIEYDGGRFLGWQTQPGGGAVQDALEPALAAIAGAPVSVTAAGRTDRGVHARGQVVHFDAAAERPDSAWVRGVTNLRGDILSVIDMRAFLGLDAAPLQSARMLVVRLLDEDFSAGLLVDSVDRIVAVSPDDIRSPESRLEGPLAAYLTGVCVIGDGVVAVLDLDRLLRSPDFRQFEEPPDIEAATVTTTMDRDAIEGRAGAQKD